MWHQTKKTHVTIAKFSINFWQCDILRITHDCNEKYKDNSFSIYNVYQFQKLNKTDIFKRFLKKITEDI